MSCIIIKIIRLMISFITGFVLIGGGIRVLDIVYLTYLTPDLLSYQVPVKSEKLVYKTCDPVILIFERRSKIQTKLMSYTELINLDTGVKTIRSPRAGDIEAENTTVKVAVDLGCKEEANYRMEGVFQYTIRGVTKDVYWYSEDFVITDGTLF